MVGVAPCDRTTHYSLASLKGGSYVLRRSSAYPLRSIWLGLRRILKASLILSCAFWVLMDRTKIAFVFMEYYPTGSAGSLNNESHDLSPTTSDAASRPESLQDNRCAELLFHQLSRVYNPETYVLRGLHQQLDIAVAVNMNVGSACGCSCYKVWYSGSPRPPIINKGERTPPADIRG